MSILASILTITNAMGEHLAKDLSSWTDDWREAATFVEKSVAVREMNTYIVKNPEVDSTCIAVKSHTTPTVRLFDLRPGDYLVDGNLVVKGIQNIANMTIIDLTDNTAFPPNSSFKTARVVRK